MDFSIKLLVICQTLTFIFFCTCKSDEIVCDRRPLGTKTQPLTPDNRFVLDIEEIGEQYLPGNSYPIRLYSKDNVSTFIAFSISVLEQKTSDNIPKTNKNLKLGFIRPSADDGNIMKDPNCENTVKEVDIKPKTSVKAIWTAPSKGSNTCVTINALLAVTRDVWYKYDNPLSKTFCEDSRNVEDMPPMLNKNCQACEDARYLVTFAGMWSYNTHLHMFPQPMDLVRFSDLVGATHNENYYIYRNNDVATQGLKILAEQANTTELEIEIRKKLGKDVRTIVKANGPPKTNMRTTATFRTSAHHHLLSLVTAIVPSPDWFLGVSNLELCNIVSKQWSKNIKLNLYPIDAGTDSGTNFTSGNDQTMPPQPVSTVVNKSQTKDTLKPFAKLHIQLIRTYTTPFCIDDSLRSTMRTSTDITSVVSEETTQSSVTEVQETSTHNPIDTCPVSNWTDWEPCEGECINGVIVGMQFKRRYHIVDGVEIKFSESESSNEKIIPQHCLEEKHILETQDCSAPCDKEETAEAQRRIWRKQISPGNNW